MNWFFKRLREPSTWLGLAMIAPGIVAAGPMSPLAIAQLVAGIAGVLVPEQGAGHA